MFMPQILLPFLLATEIDDRISCRDVEYKSDDAVLEGYLCYDKTINKKRPGIVVVHAWYGISDFTKLKCRELARLGYTAFAADVYGKGVRPSSMEEAREQATKYRKDRPLMRRRVNAALNELKRNEFTDPGKLAAIGYCFGGGAALELARSGADIKGVVSFHGNLDTPDLNDAENIKGKVLICHGADDKSVTIDSVVSFIQEMKNAHVNYEIDIYGGAVHAFTNPASGNDPDRGVAYNKQADERSWGKMISFFNEIFSAP